MTQMLHLPQMAWDFNDQLARTQQQVVNNAPGQTTCYVYDASGQRVRKVTQSGGGTRTKERIYLGGYEVYREYASDGSTVTLERQTLHVMDDKRRVAMAETKTTSGAVPILRYQFDNHLGSASLELDASAAIISYEEYCPYGSTSYQAMSSAIQVSPKRYRYTGKERDEETGFSYHGARYYAPWLGRWTAPDPAGFADSKSLYVYVAGNPCNMHDPTGRQRRTFGGLTVSPESKISAQQWVSMIQSSDKLAPWMKSLFAATGNRIVLTTDHPRLPAGVTWDQVPEWFKNTLVAINSKDWHLTTGASELSDQHELINYKLLPDKESGDAPGGTSRVAKTDITVGETVASESREPRESMLSRRMADDSAGGATNPLARRPRQGNKPAEGLVVVADRFHDPNAPGSQQRRSDSAMLETFFHELGAHAGLVSQGKPAAHGPDGGVTPTEADILAQAVRSFFANPTESPTVAPVPVPPRENIWERAKHPAPVPPPNPSPSQPRENVWERAKRAAQ